MRATDFPSTPPLKFYYRNWKGKCSYRTVSGVKSVWYGESEYHKGNQWFLTAFDLEKDDFRDFALIDIIEFVKE